MSFFKSISLSIALLTSINLYASENNQLKPSIHKIQKDVEEYIAKAEAQLSEEVKYNFLNSSGSLSENPIEKAASGPNSGISHANQKPIVNCYKTTRFDGPKDVKETVCTEAVMLNEYPFVTIKTTITQD